MSIDFRTLRREQARDAVLEYELIRLRPLSPSTLDWMHRNWKTYNETTLNHFGVAEAVAICYERAYKRRRSKWAEPVITFPAGPVTRIYRYTCPTKSDRWRVAPTGFSPQFIGTITGPDVLLCEGEWDTLTAFDHGFTYAATHTAGAVTWLPGWTPLFTGKRVAICYDRDTIGMKGAAKIAMAIWPVAAKVRIVELPLPGSPTSKDLSDFFRVGATVQDFQKLLDGARHYVPRHYPTGRR